MTIALNTYNAWRTHLCRNVKDAKAEMEYLKTDNWKIAQEIIELRTHGKEQT